MRIAVTGATGFLGRYIVSQLVEHGHLLRCWHRATSDRSGFNTVSRSIDWESGSLGDVKACARLVSGCDAVVHAALEHSGAGFRGGEGPIVPFVQANVLGTLQLIEAAKGAGVTRFVFISSCAVHEKILEDRPLDEAHPLWASHHYGAHKAAVEKFVHSYGYGEGFPICALRPTGIYGLAHPVSESKWFDLVRRVAAGETVHCERGGKEVHAADVARAVGLLLDCEPAHIAGEAFNCYDRSVSEWDVAHLAKEFSRSDARIEGHQATPKHQISTEKIKRLGMTFGGWERLQSTIAKLVAACRAS